MLFSLIGMEHKHILSNFNGYTTVEATPTKVKMAAVRPGVNKITYFKHITERPTDNTIVEVQQHVGTKEKTLRCKSDQENQRWLQLPEVHMQ